MDGKAVFTTEMSSTTRIWAVSATASTAHDLRGPLSSVGGGADGAPAVAAGADGRGAVSVTLMAAPRLIGCGLRLVRRGSVRAGTMAGFRVSAENPRRVAR